jgi:hypothetical protein
VGLFYVSNNAEATEKNAFTVYFALFDQHIPTPSKSIYTHTHTHSGHNGSPPLSAHVCKCVRACYDVVFPQIARNTTQLSTPLVVCAYALKSARVCTGLPDCATSCFRGRGLRGAQRDGHRTHRTATTQDENEM